MMKNFLLLLSFETGCSLFCPPPLFSSSDSVPPLCSSVAMDSPPLKNPPCKPHTSCSSTFSALSAANAWDLLLRAVSFFCPSHHAHWLPHHTKDSVKDKCPWPIQFNQHHTCCVPAGPDVGHCPDCSARLTDRIRLTPTL